MKNSRMPTSREPRTAAVTSVRQRFGKEREQRHAEQRADRVADEPRHEPRARAIR